MVCVVEDYVLVEGFLWVVVGYFGGVDVGCGMGVGGE